MLYKKIRQIIFIGCLLSLNSCMEVPPSVNMAIEDVIGDIDPLLDLYTDSYRDTGCDMQLLVNGEASYEVFVDMIESAEDHINVETLNFDNDKEYERDVALEFVLRFVAKVEQGVQVNIILDPIVQKIYGDEGLVDILREGGVNVIPYTTPEEDPEACPILYRTHKKLMIVDGRQAVIGGMNFGYSYLAPNQWRDTNVLLTGPVVTTMQQEFLRDWQALGGTIDDESRYLPPLEPTGELTIRSIDQRPSEGDFDINDFLMIAIRSAEQYIDIEAPYFNPTDWLVEELTDAANRGVQIRILTNSEISTDISSTFYVSLFWFETMLKNGIEVYLWNQYQVNMHSKAMVVDGRLAMIGSHNFNYRSIVWDTENSAAFTDLPAITEIQQMIDNDLNQDWVLQIDLSWLDQQELDSLDLLLPYAGLGWLF